jgi:hypothetical protein
MSFVKVSEARVAFRSKAVDNDWSESILSHANGRLCMQRGIQGEGEHFMLNKHDDGLYTVKCLGGEKRLYLSGYGLHTQYDRVIKHDHEDGSVSLEFYEGICKGQFLTFREYLSPEFSDGDGSIEQRWQVIMV